MFLPWAQAIKQTNPQVSVIGGWDYQMNAEGWQVWKILYQPFIDAAVPWLDGITEHHYGSDTRKNAATYEVAVGYTMAEHGKWLRCFNTETAGCVDPAVPGNRHGNATPYGAYNYGLRDIIELCFRCPAKAMSRAAHGSLREGWGGGGDEFLFKLLKEFRGRLVHATSDDLNVWPAASLGKNKLVLLLYNDHGTEQLINLAVDAPQGTEFTGVRQIWVEPQQPQGPLSFQDRAIPAQGRQFKGQIRLPRQSGAKLVFALAGTPAERIAVLRRQFYAKGTFKPVTLDATAEFTVSVNESLLTQAESAWIKVVLEGRPGDGGVVRLNGTRIPLPDYNWITEVLVNPSLLRSTNLLEFATTGEGYQVDVASLVIDVPRH
jgi:hypothetical protein